MCPLAVVKTLVVVGGNQILSVAPNMSVTRRAEAMTESYPTFPFKVVAANSFASSLDSDACSMAKVDVHASEDF